MKYFTTAALFLIISLHATASTPVTGTFEATEYCPAYLSKNKKTNPSNIFIQSGEKYELIEINKTKDPDWLRIQTPDEDHPLRWVSATCGKAAYDKDSQPSGNCQQLPGLADSYVLALSWHPGFCQTYGYEAGKPECFHLSKQAYAATHVTLHGLWPNQNSCGQNYGYCAVAPQGNHCDYSPLAFSDRVANDLKTFMPSYAYGGCLERHEWYKHGSCQILTPDGYFSLAMNLVHQVDATVFGQFLHEHVGQQVDNELLRQKISDALGANNRYKIYLGCKNGYLVDIFIQLPALIPANESLVSIINKAPDLKRYNGCPSMVRISNFTNKDWE